jgi:hypothetical protein
MYKATIQFDSYLDNYESGQIGNSCNQWETDLTAKTTEELKAKILIETYQTDWRDVEHDDINEYEQWSEYHTSYMTNVNNEGEATEAELEKWREGKLELYSVDCHILVSKVTEEKAVL